MSGSDSEPNVNEVPVNIEDSVLNDPRDNDQGLVDTSNSDYHRYNDSDGYISTIKENPSSHAFSESSSRAFKELTPWQNKMKHILVFCLIVGLVLCWVTMAEVIQGLGDPSSPVYYPKPYLQAWLTHSSYAIFLVFWIVWLGILKLTGNHEGYRELTVGIPVRKIFLICAIPFNIFLFLLLYTWYLSLPRTYVAINTAIYNCSPVFVFVFSVFALKEKVTREKVAGLMLCIVGIVLIPLMQPKSNRTDITPTVFGYCCLLATTLTYAGYEVLIKKIMEGTVTAERKRILKLHINSDEKDENITVPPLPIKTEMANSLLLLGSVGVGNLVLLWVGLIIWNVTGIEPFQWPSTPAIFNMMFLDVGLDAIFNIFLVAAITLSNPLLVAVGQMTTIPVAVIVDSIVHGIFPPFWVLFGMFLIFIGVLVNHSVYPKWKWFKKRFANESETEPILNKN